MTKAATGPSYPPNIVPMDGLSEEVIREAISGRAGEPGAGTFYWRYDEALLDWVKSVTTSSGYNVPIVSSPTRAAFGEYDRLFRNAHAQKDPGKTDLSNIGKPPLPFISFYRRSSSPLPNRLNGNLPLRNLRLLDNTVEQTEGGSKREVTWSRPPTVWDLTFQLDIWADWQRNLATISQSLLTQLWHGKVAYWTVKNPFGGWSKMPIKMLGSVEDSTDISPSGETVFRQTLTLTVEAMMWYDEMSAKTVLTETRLVEVEGGGEVETSVKLTSLAPLTSKELSELNSAGPGGAGP